MRVALILSLLIASQAATRADDLDVIVDLVCTPEARGQAYDRLVKQDFSTYAKKLAKLRGTHPVMTGIGPSTKQPWSEERLSYHDRIACTLYQLWYEQMSDQNTRLNCGELMLEMVDNETLGISARRIALEEIRVPRMNSAGAKHPAELPPREAILSTLDRIVRNEAEPAEFRRSVMSVLFANGDPNIYIGLAVHLASYEPTASRRAEAFRMCTSADSSRFTEEGRKKYVRQCFEYLEQEDDHQSGSGYFLASHLGVFLHIPPIRRGLGNFAPDQKLPKYQGPEGLKGGGYYQDTVDNAMKWWAEHKGEY